MKTFKTYLEELDSLLSVRTESLKSYNMIFKNQSNELKEIRDTLQRSDWILSTTWSLMSYWSYNTEEETINLIDDTLKKDYFTKEFINADATNTRELYVVNWDSIKIELFKEWNQTKEVKEIQGKLYLFIN